MSKRKQVAVILSGCGVFDGSEVHESVLTLLALDEADARWTVVAPDVPQMHVVNHHSGEPTGGETRHVHVEAARIARGPVTPLDSLTVTDFDAIILPGGFGAAKNLCTFASEGAECSVLPALADKLREARAAGIPLGFLCIAPVIAARVFGGEAPTLTIGNDADTARAIEAMGATHRECAVDDIVVDEDRRIVTTPAYMLAERLTEANAGIRRLVAAVLGMA